MRLTRTLATLAGVLLLALSANAAEPEDSDALKISALEALMVAPAERAFPIVKRVLEGDHSNEVKTRALFVLSQIRGAEAEAMLLGLAVDNASPLQLDAIRMVGIGGDDDSLARLAAIYRNGNESVRESVLGAYLIAREVDQVLTIAQNASDESEFDRAVQTLAAMNATEALRQLGDRAGKSDGLLRAYAMSGDLDSLVRIVDETTDTQQRVRAIRHMGLVGHERAGARLVEIYRNGDAEVRDAALHGLLVNGYDAGLLQLYRESTDTAEKRRLLRTLVNMNSDLALDIIDATLEGQ